MNLVPDIRQRPGPQQQVSIRDAGDEQKSLQENEDSQYQEIFYWKGSIADTAPSNPNGFKPIDLPKALDETMNLVNGDPTYKDPHDAQIMFYNQKNFDSLGIIRTREDLWSLSTPVFCDDDRCRFKHITNCNTRRLVDIIEALFVADDWHGMADFRFARWVYEFEMSYSGPDNPDAIRKAI